MGAYREAQATNITTMFNKQCEMFERADKPQKEEPYSMIAVIIFLLFIVMFMFSPAILYVLAQYL